MDQARRQLLELLREKSFRYSPNNPFTLASGRVSPYYIDCRPVTHNAHGLFLIGEIFCEMLQDLRVDAVGGLTMGADPIAHAIALTSYLKGRPINAFSVRKAAKEYGAQRLIEGDIKLGDKVVILEDVISSGSSTTTAINAARNFGLEVAEVLILVDREEGGKQKVQKLIPKVNNIFKLSEFI